MTDEDTYLRAARITVLANAYSPLLRDELLSRPDIVAQDEIEMDAAISLGADNLSFLRSQLFPAIAAAYDGVSTPLITSVEGDEWTVTFAGEANPQNVAFLHGGQRLLVPEFALLAIQAEPRLHAFQLFADKHRLLAAVRDRWCALLSERVPKDHEIMALLDDLQNTTIGVTEAIRQSLERGNLSLDILVPRSEGYYRQLVGDASRAATLEDYVAQVAAPFLAELLADGHPQSLSLAWCLCSHQSISPLIERQWSGDDRGLTKALLWLAKNGDPISCAGAIEFGLRRAQQHPLLLRPLAELIKAFLALEPDAKTDEFALLSPLFCCVYGQIARCRTLATWPPFARRLAALAHASLVVRHVAAVVADRSGLVSWLLGLNENYFVVQILLDMRVEPRWFPELGSAEQWKNELWGRVWTAANQVPDVVEALGLTERLIGEAPQAMIHQIDRMAAHLSGPLEGGASTPIVLSLENTAKIAEKLKGTVDTTTFGSLINASMWFRISDQLADLAAEALERSYYQIRVDDDVSLPICLLGLASVAAVSRSTKLREAIHTALRVSRRGNPGQLTPEEMFRVGVFACAAHVELTDWTGRVGEFMTELSLQDLAREDAEALHSHLSMMCHLVPELWGTCGQAEAGFGLVIGR